MNCSADALLAPDKACERRQKFENFQAAALNCVYLSLYKTRGAIRITPVQAAGNANSTGGLRNGLDVVANKDYIERLKEVIFDLYKSDAQHVESVPVEEIFHGKIIWKGDVEVFTLTNHPQAKRCYGWSHPGGGGNTDERFVTVLEIPPVASPETAVQIAIMAETRDKE